MSGRLTPAIWILALVAAGPAAVIPAKASPPPRPYTVDNYDVAVRVDLGQQRLYGEAAIRLRGRGDNAVSALEMEGGGLKITNVREGDVPQPFEQNRKSLFVTLIRPIRPDEQRTITVQYEASPAAGLKFSAGQVVASAVGDWMPCDDSAGERATLHLKLSTAPDLKVAASGKLAGTSGDAGQTTSEWRLDSPAEPWRFGFAAGKFSEEKSEVDGVSLRVLGAGKEIADATGAAMQFFAGRTGKHYPGDAYTQVFTDAGVTGSFAGGLALLPDSYAQKLKTTPDDLWLLADQLAQQWFGIAIVPKTWSDVWLSDGVSAFLADAFLGQKFGKERYERELKGARQAYDQLRLEGADRPLSNDNWTTRQEVENGIPQYKGAWFLYLLNQMVGDTAFENAFRLYTANAWGQEVNSEDFQRAFETVTGSGRGGEGNEGKKGRPAARAKSPKGIDELFDMWVYGIASAAPKKHR